VTAAAIIPRPDQVAAHDAVISALDSGIRRPLAVEPMAWGKSILLALLVCTLLRRGLRVLVLAHRKELLAQNHGVLRRLDTTVDAGLLSAGLGADNTSARALIAGTATVYRRLHRIGHVDVILLDEAHLLGPGGATMLAKIREHLGDPPIVGLTATAFRTDSAMLVEADIFDTIVHETTLRDALAAGLLCPLITKAPQAGRINLSGVSIVAGEYHARQLEAAAMAGDTTRLAVARMVEIALAEQRRSWLIFSSGVDHAHQIARELRQRGVRCAVIVGDTPSDERDTAITAFREGMITALVNCNVLTTGFDATRIDLVAFMRATCSPVLWVQAAGRGMRLHPAKENCRLVDFGSNISRHGPIDAVRLRAKGERHDANAAAATTRVCPQCDEVNARSAAVCTACGFELIQRPQPKPIAVVESTLSAISDGNTDSWEVVHTWRAAVHHKSDGAPSFRLMFVTDETLVSEFFSFEHTSSGARWHAARKWKLYSRHVWLAPPQTAHEAFERFTRGELRQPQRVRLERNGRWLNIAESEFAAEVA
jgi:DNA repair protein RadD